MIDKKKPVKNKNTISIDNKYSTTSSRGLPITTNIAELDENDIDNLINDNKLQKKQYSKSQVELYKPLSNKEKIKVLEDLNNNSDMRIMLYSELFKEIKSQITTLSEFSTSQAYNKYSMDNIMEEDLDQDERIDECHMSNRKMSSKKHRIMINNTPTFEKTQSKGLFDWRDSEENKGLIHIPQSVYKSNTLNSLDIMSNPKYMYKEKRKSSKLGRTTQL
jgi:hypothetical protein